MQGLLFDPRAVQPPQPSGGGSPLGQEGLLQLDALRQKLIKRYLEDGLPVPPELRQGTQQPQPQPVPRGLLQPAMGDVVDFEAMRRGRKPGGYTVGGGGGVRPPATVRTFEPKKPPAEKPNINIQKQERGETWGPKTPGWNMLSSEAKTYLYGKPVKGSEYEGLVTSRAPSARGTGLNYDKMTPKEWKALLKSGESKEGLKPFTVEQWNAATRGEPQQFSGRNPPSAKDTAQTSFGSAARTEMADKAARRAEGTVTIPRSSTPQPKLTAEERVQREKAFDATLIERGINPKTGKPMTPAEREASARASYESVFGPPKTLAERRALTNSLLGEAPQRSPIGPGSTAYESGIQGLRAKVAEGITSKQKGEAIRNEISAWASKAGIPTSKAVQASEQIRAEFAKQGMSVTPDRLRYLITLAHRNGKL